MSPSHALLGLLVQGERYGYELKRAIEQEFTPFWRINFAQLYRSLAKMTQQGWIKVRLESGSDGPDRKMYTLTPRGRHAFETWLQEPSISRDEFFIKLRLANTAGIALDQPIAEQRRALEAERVARQTALREARAIGDTGRIILADASLRDNEAALAVLALWGNAKRTPIVQMPQMESAALIITGSDDPLLTFLAQLVSTSTSPVGSLGGLLALSHHEADVAGIHLLDIETGNYNVSFVKHILPEERTVLVNLASRQNGLLVAPGNPKHIRGVRDLVRSDVRLINRQHGAGTRLLLFAKLRAARIDPHSLPGWDRVAWTHDAVATAITSGTADVGPGLAAVAAERGLDFIPLGEEQYDLVIPQSVYESPRVQPLLKGLHSAAFRQEGSKLKGYDLSRAGQVVARVK
jgi:molybdate-binding protein/DNA-binding PadR family transcriptional regulator